MDEETLRPTFRLFQVQKPQGSGEEMIAIRKHSELPYLADQDLGEIIFRKGQWTVRRKEDSWIYLNYAKEEIRGDKGTGEGRARDGPLQKVAVFSADHTRVRVYGKSSEEEQDRGQAYNDWIHLTQTSLSQVLANRQGCFLHSSGVVLGESGILFLGHSGAGKSTLRKMILSSSKTATLCDDRNVVRRGPEGYRVHGVWANKDLSDVTAASPPLCAIMFVVLGQREQDHTIAGPNGGHWEAFVLRDPACGECGLVG